MSAIHYYIRINEENLQLHAFHELVTVVSGNTPDAKFNRGLIYSDTKHSPTMWSTLVRQSLALLDEDHQLLLRRGKPAPPTPRTCLNILFNSG